jgi:hypothetical protein
MERPLSGNCSMRWRSTVEPMVALSRVTRLVTLPATVMLVVVVASFSCGSTVMDWPALTTTCPSQVCMAAEETVSLYSPSAIDGKTKKSNSVAPGFAPRGRRHVKQADRCARNRRAGRVAYRALDRRRAGLSRQRRHGAGHQQGE